jgi:hypothetical protein
MNITIIMRDGTKREFKHEGRAGGSYTKSVRYEGGFCIVTDEWYSDTAIPQELIAEVRTENPRERW